MFGADKLKPLQKELKITGVNQKMVRNWITQYKKIQKHYPKIQNGYEVQRKKLEELQTLLKHMEVCFISGKDMKKELWKDAEKLKNMKDISGHEFLVDEGNIEFELTFSKLKKRMTSIKKVSEDEMLFLHSETENLADMVQEILQQQKPNLYALTYFSVFQKEGVLKDLSYEEKRKKVERIYKQNFMKPMEEILSAAMEKANAKTPLLSIGDKSKAEQIAYIVEEWIWR